MSQSGSPVDCVYVAASRYDARYTRTCVASIRCFYPEIPIRLLAGGRLQRGLASELRDYWNVGTADLPQGDYGWGFVKLEALFGRPGERFLVLDSDTVVTGPVLEVWRDSCALFLVDDEKQSEADTKRLYYDWEAVRKFDRNAAPPQFVFNSGQWFGTAGVLKRDDFAQWVEWTMPPRLRHPEHFMPGDQGILNYVINQKAQFEGLAVARRRIMCYPLKSMDGLNAEKVSRRVAPPLVVHWSGCKRMRQRDMIGADLLTYFEKLYFRRLPASETRRLFAIGTHFFTQCLHAAQIRIKLRFKKLAQRAGLGPACDHAPLTPF